MMRKSRTYGSCLGLATLMMAVAPLSGFDGRSAGSEYFPNQVLRDQNGRAVRFYSDLLQGKTIVIHSFFASCHGACPVMFGKLKAIQDLFGDHLGKNLLFLSISVDPGNDEPAKLQEVAASLNARPGWLFLSGAKPNVDWVLYKLGQYVPVREEHSTVFLVGNEPAGVWTKLNASLPAETLRQRIEQVRQSTQSAK